MAAGGGRGWSNRQAAIEGGFFRYEEAAATRKHIERMVREGRLPESSLPHGMPSSSGNSSNPLTPAYLEGRAIQWPDIEVRSWKDLPEQRMRFKYLQEEFPGLTRSPMEQFKLGTSVSLGRGRFAGGEASIWDISAGRALANTPSKQATWAEQIRAQKIAQAQYESPVVQGFRLLPEFTPGRAFFWGTVLAVWGTTVGVLVVKKSMGLTMDNIQEKIRAAGEPFKQALEDQLEPMRETATAALHHRQATRDQDGPELFVKLRTILK